MIAVALSGGLDSSAAAILLHEQRQHLIGLTLALDETTPVARQVDRARMLCRHLGVPHHVLPVGREFKAVKDYFCQQYLAGRTPNPCVVCNRDMKFGLLLDRAMALGADRIATGHYVKAGFHAGRRYVARASETNSQEYFLGLVGQRALARAIFPLGELSRTEARRIVASAGLDVPATRGSQDVCFIGQGGYAAFIEAHTGYRPHRGTILDAGGRTVGFHRGALRYTVGQRKGLGIGLGRRVYVLAVDAARNTITVGESGSWRHKGFLVPEVNFMKMPGLQHSVACHVKVRYRQDARPAVLHPEGKTGARVDFDDLFAPGQLAVFYDSDGAVLCAGTIELLQGDCGARASCLS